MDFEVGTNDVIRADKLKLMESENGVISLKVAADYEAPTTM
jgi:hypothetical protein